MTSTVVVIICYNTASAVVLANYRPYFQKSRRQLQLSIKLHVHNKHCPSEVDIYRRAAAAAASDVEVNWFFDVFASFSPLHHICCEPKASNIVSHTTQIPDKIFKKYYTTQNASGAANLGVVGVRIPTKIQIVCVQHPRNIYRLF